MMKLRIAPILAVLVTGAAGFFLGRWSQRPGGWTTQTLSHRSSTRPVVTPRVPRTGGPLSARDLAARVNDRRQPDVMSEVSRQISNMSPANIAILVHEFAARKDAGESDSNLLYLSFSAWTIADPDAAFDFLKTRNPGSLFGGASSAITGLALVDPERARKRLAELTDPDEARTARTRLFQVVAETNPEVWMAWSKAEPNTQGGIPRSWAESDPAETARRLESLPNLLPGSAPMLAGIWSGQDPAAALKWVESIKDAAVRDAAKSAITSKSIVDDPDAAIAALSAAPAPQRSDGLIAAINFLADRHPDLAYEKVMALPDPIVRADVLSNVLGTSDLSLAEKIGTFPAITSPSGREKMLTALGNCLGRNGGANLPVIVNKFPPEERRRLVQQILASHPASDVEGKEELLRQFLPEDR